MDRRRILVVVVAIVCLLAVGGGYLIYQKVPSGTKMDMNSYFGVEDEGSYGLIINDQLVMHQPEFKNGGWYIEQQVVNTYCSSKYYWDGGQLIYTTATQIFSVKPDESIYTDGVDSTILSRPACYQAGEAVYISLEFLEKTSGVYTEEFDNPAYLYVRSRWQNSIMVGDMVKESSLRYEAAIKSPVIKKTEAGEHVTVLKTVEDWSYIQTKEGYLGYVKSEDITQTKETTTVSVTGYVPPEYTTLRTEEDNICLAWHQVFGESGVNALDDILNRATAMTVIVPTWFSLTDNDGTVLSLADEAYVEKAHAAGKQVWGLIENINYDVDSFAILSDTAIRGKIIDTLISEALRVNLDGINVDLEALTAQTGPHYMQFVRELSVSCRREGLVLSVDHYVPTGSTSFYGRAEQGTMIDYLIIMAYDEYWAGGKSAGPTSSIPFVKDGIENTILEAPAESIIVALPFYTRLWCETPERLSGANTVIIRDEKAKYPAYSLSSETKGLDAAQALIQERKLTTEWLEDKGLNYAEYEYQNCFYRIWIEDLESLKKKLALTDEYPIAGIAFWKLGLDSTQIWPVVEQHMNQ